MKIIVNFILATTLVCCNFAYASTDKGKENVGENKLSVALSRTNLKDRIVGIVYNGNDKEDVVVTVAWRPKNTDRMLHDMLTIMETVSETVPRYASVSLRAFESSGASTAEKVIWRASISKSSFALLQGRRQQKNIRNVPTPLYQK